MKKNIKWIIVAVLLVGLIGGAYALYDNLGDDVLMSTPETTTSQSTANNVTTEEKEETKPDYRLAHDFTVIDENGNEKKLSDYRGKSVVINFWTTWCYYCKEEMPNFNEAFKKYPDVQFLMIQATDNVTETADVAKAFKQNNGYEFPIYFDVNREAVSAYGVTSYPQSYFVDKDGYLIARQPGAMKMETLEKGIAMITG